MQRTWVEITLAGAALVVGSAFSFTTYLQSERAHKTSETLTDIEDRRARTEERDAEVADFVGRFMAGDCDAQVSMERFPMIRWFDEPAPVSRTIVYKGCLSLGRRPALVLESQTVVGPIGAHDIRVLAVLHFNVGDPQNGRGRTSYLDMTLARSGGPRSEMKVTGLAEVVINA